MTFEEFTRKFSIQLTAQQTAAVKSVEGASLLLAVPGSGKTTVLVARLGYMIYCAQIAPESILTMTYTVAATHDMKARFRQMFGSDICDRLEFRTINGVCSRIIQSYEYAAGTKAFDLISDEKEIASFISTIYREVTGSFPTESDIKGVRTLITYAKNMMLTSEKISALDRQCPSFSKMYRCYCDLLRARKLMDYDDQLVYALNILQRYPVILEQMQQKYRYICVDEAQDTSKIQHEIIAAIAKKHCNLFMVGDEDQSIYGFRAAYPQALMTFEQKYPGAKVLLMEQNFRSNAKIVAAADSFISKNLNRRKKNMCAARPEGEDICEISLRARCSQYDHIVKMVSESSCETAILYRDNESALPLADIFERKGIKYRVKAGDLTFFSHRIVQDIRNIITLACNPYDTEAFLQVYYKLGTYLNKTSAAIACDISRQENISIWDAVFSIEEELTAGALKGCRAVKSDMERLCHEPADRVIERIYRNMGYREYLDRMNMKSGKITILKAIGANEPTCTGLLRRLDELERMMKSTHYDPDCRLILSTIHSSKGLEYDRVLLIDVCDGIFPETYVHSIQNVHADLAQEYEEERRLFYVGATRARNTLCLFTYADETSHFCDELCGKAATAEGIAEACSSAGTKTEPASSSLAGYARTKDSWGYDDFSERCTAGSQIIHRFFGEGKIISRTGDVMLVEFGSGQQKKLSLQSLYQQKLLQMKQ